MLVHSRQFFNTKSAVLIMSEKFDFIASIALNWYKKDKKVAIATVIETWGSSPRPIGSQLVISDDRNFMGSVSGGCVEGAVIEAAVESIEKGSCQIIEFGVTNETAFSVGLPCGGNIRIMIEPIGLGNGLPLEFLERLDYSAALGIKCFIVTDIRSYKRSFFEGDKYVFGDLSSDLSYQIVEDNKTLRSSLLSTTFINVFAPTLKLIIVGAVHISQYLIEIAKLAGYEVILIEPREAFFLRDGFSDVELISEWPDKSLKDLTLDNYTALVVLAHDPKLDDAALIEAIASDAFYIGCLGSNTNHEKRLQRLKLAGCAEEKLVKIHAPIGLDIGAKTPLEIALSIMAEIILKFRKNV